MSIKDRIKNLVWTVGEDYKSEVDVEGALSYTDTENVKIANPEVYTRMGFSNKDADAICMYGAAHEGAHVRLSNIEAMKEGMKKAKAEGTNLDTLNQLIQITEDLRVDTTTMKERPGYADLRMKGVAPLSEKFADDTSGDETHNMFKAISSLTYDIDLRELSHKYSKLDWDKIEGIANHIKESVDRATSSWDSVRIAKDIYNTYFTPPIESKGDDGKGEGDGEGEGEGDESEDGSEESSGKGSSSRASERPSDADRDGDDTSDGDSDEESEGGRKTEEADGADGDDTDGDSEEHDSDCGDDSSDSASDGVDGDGDTEIRDMVSDSISSSPMDSLIGKDSLDKVDKSIEEVKRAESYKASKDEIGDRVKDGIIRDYGKSFLTPPEVKEREKLLCKDIHAGTRIHWVKPIVLNKSDYSHRYKCRSESNKKAYINTRAIYSGQARKLSQIIRDELQAARDPYAYESDNGSIIANKMWKPKSTGDTKVFAKADYIEIGNFVFDILLDASGSQGSRQPDVAIQGKILADALTSLHIPVRVSSFRVVSNTTILERFRDYDDPQECNRDILEYVASGDNRDGLAIASVAYDLNRRSEANKVMLVLSDGLPEDSSGGRAVSIAGGAAIYSNPNGVNDTANVIRKLRKDMSVVGIYTGVEKDYILEQEKTMFGNDFAYIRDVKAFSGIAGNIICKHIRNAGV